MRCRTNLTFWRGCSDIAYGGHLPERLFKKDIRPLVSINSSINPFRILNTMFYLNARNALVWTAALCAIVTQSEAKHLPAKQSLPDLRILPIGDSITRGAQSSDDNGYRQYLRNKLLAYDSTAHVDMIGTLRSGDMADNNHEGHSGEYVEDIITYWQKPFTAEPNVVLIHIGTNNMNQNHEVAKAPERMTAMIDEMLVRLPDIVIVVAQVIHSKKASTNERSAAFNAKLKDIIKTRRDGGKHILFVDIGIKDDDLKDDVHPNDTGYAKMGEGWYQKIVKANGAGWLKNHGDANPPDVGIGIDG
jgi:lysophospholipase L1-like esterase